MKTNFNYFCGLSVLSDNARFIFQEQKPEGGLVRRGVDKVIGENREEERARYEATILELAKGQAELKTSLERIKVMWPDEIDKVEVEQNYVVSIFNKRGERIGAVKVEPGEGGSRYNVSLNTFREKKDNGSINAHCDNINAVRQFFVQIFEQKKLRGELKLKIEQEAAKNLETLLTMKFPGGLVVRRGEDNGIYIYQADGSQYAKLESEARITETNNYYLDDDGGYRDPGERKASYSWVAPDRRIFFRSTDINMFVAYITESGNSLELDNFLKGKKPRNLKISFDDTSEIDGMGGWVLRKKGKFVSLIGTGNGIFEAIEEDPANKSYIKRIPLKSLKDVETYINEKDRA